ncbi:MAG: glycosyltransferase family 1 protein, partial [Chitinophagaceae bacterium]
LKNKFLFKWSAKRAKIVTTVSEYSRQKIEKHFGIENIILTPNAVEDIFFEDYNKEEVQANVQQRFGLENYIIYISRHEPRKNHYRLLKVFAEAFQQDYQLLFIGDKAIPDPKFEALLQSLPHEVASKVTMLGKVAFPDMLLLLRGASVSVYPSIAEGFGIPPLEAAAAGIPSVCSNTTAMADFTMLSNALFDPFSENEMKLKIKQVMATAYTTEISKRVQQEFNWQKGASALWKAIKAIPAKNP